MQRRHTETTVDYYSISHQTEWHYENIESVLSTSELAVPVSIFSSEIPALQATVRYLRENLFLGFGDIAALLGRAESTVRVTYRNAPKDTLPVDDSLLMPLSAFDLGLSPLETVVYFLRNKGLRNVEVATLIAKDPRTTAVVLKRAKEKGVVLHV